MGSRVSRGGREMKDRKMGGLSKEVRGFDGEGLRDRD